MRIKLVENESLRAEGRARQWCVVAFWLFLMNMDGVVKEINVEVVRREIASPLVDKRVMITW